MKNFYLILFVISFVSCSSFKKSEIEQTLKKNYKVSNSERYIPLWSRNLREWISKYGKVKNTQDPDIYYFLEEEEISKTDSCDLVLREKLNKKIFYEISLYLKANHFDYLISKQAINKNDMLKIDRINNYIKQKINENSEIYRTDEEERIYPEESKLYCRSLSKISKNSFREIIGSSIKMFKSKNRSPQMNSNYELFFRSFNNMYNKRLK